MFNRELPRAVWIAAIIVVLTLGLVWGVTRQRTVMIRTGGINVRQGPGLDYNTIAQTQARKRYHVLAERNDWYKIRLTDTQYGWVASWLVNRKKPLKNVTRLSEATIVIDAGHGGSDSGAEYHTDSKNPKYMEKTYTLQMANRVADELRLHGAHVIMTRDNDRYVGLRPRPALAEILHADAFISFHYDSSPQRNEASGITTYYYHNGASKQLARCLSHEYSNLPLTNKGIDFGDFLVIRDNTRPAVLCEMGYINTTKDFHQIRRLSYQLKVASDVTKGLEKYLAQQ